MIALAPYKGKIPGQRAYAEMRDGYIVLWNGASLSGDKETPDSNTRMFQPDTLYPLTGMASDGLVLVITDANGTTHQAYWI